MAQDLFFFFLESRVQSPADPLCFSRLGHFENKDVESAFVAKYEITLDECLAWTKAKSRPLCCAINFLFLWKRNTSAPQPSPPPPPFGSSAWVSSLLSGALQCNQRKAIQSEYQRLPVLFDFFYLLSPTFFFLFSELGFHSLIWLQIMHNSGNWVK